MNAFVIDAFEFCRLKERSEGEIAVADLPRLADESVDKSGSVQWSFQGGNDKQGRPQLELSLRGGVRLVCQRCLAPFDFHIASKSVLVLAQHEEEADEIEALLVDEPVEIIVGSRVLNVVDLIEDEALLAMPLSPKHGICLDQSVPEMSSEAEAISPFAVLKNLKQ
jgi:uncharacterized protein